MKNAFLIFLMAQFLNVQIQTAYGSEGIREVARSALESELLTKLEKRLEGLGERRRMYLAYRLFKLDIKLRNRLALMSDEQVRNRLERRLSDEMAESIDSKNSEDQAIAEELASIDGLDAIEAPEEVVSKGGFAEPGLITKAALLADADQLLESLGAVRGESGELFKVSYSSFKEHLSNDLGKVVLKVILSLIVLTLGLAIITVALVYLVVYAIAGVVTTTAWFYVILFGTLIAMFFGIRAIIRASVEISPSRIRIWDHFNQSS